MFVTLALYDLKERKKVCSTETNPATSLDLLGIDLDLREFPLRFELGCIETNDSHSTSCRWINVELIGYLSHFISFARYLLDHSSKATVLLPLQDTSVGS